MKRKVVIAVTAVVVILLGVGLLGGRWLWGDNVFGHGSGMIRCYSFSCGMQVFGGGIVMFVLWGAVIGGLALLGIGLVRQGEKPAARAETALGILTRRYASGEINREEFEQIREALLR